MIDFAGSIKPGRLTTLELFGSPSREDYERESVKIKQAASNNNKLLPQDTSVHDWYRFVLSFPAHLVRSYIAGLNLSPGDTVLDPFCGTGTTLVECKKHGISGIGIERNPMAAFASTVKLSWDIDPDELLAHATRIKKAAKSRISADGLDFIDLPLFSKAGSVPCPKLLTLPEDVSKLLLKDSISPVPLHKTLVLLEELDQNMDIRFIGLERLALAKALVSGISNLCFGPEVGVGKIITDAPVVDLWFGNLKGMAEDLRRNTSTNANVSTRVFQGDARFPEQHIAPGSVDGVITSPPYPNEKDYTRTTRLESVILGLIRNKDDLRAIKQGLVRSNTRSVYKADTDDELITDIPEIMDLAGAIEKRRLELGKTSGFERMYARVTKLYFGGMTRHLAGLRAVLKPGARLAYVVGDQASYLRVMIRTGNILAGIAEKLGYHVESIDLFRTRLATATKEQLREEVVVLRWPGD
jgi:hypothetical protein